MDLDKTHYLYHIYYAMVQRCTNPNSQKYYAYGDRGITIYDTWLEDRTAFFDYMLTEVGERPEGHLLDRIDNDGNYEPGNLKWSTRSDSQFNRRSPEYYMRDKVIGESGYKWVSMNKNKWRGQFSYKKHSYYTKTLNTPLEAYCEVLRMREEMGLPLE